MEVSDPNIPEEPEWQVPADIDSAAPKAVSSWERWKSSPSPQTLSAVVKEVAPVINNAASRYHGINSHLMNAEGKRLAIQAIQSYDPSAQASLNTHVFNHLRPLGRFAQKTTRAVSVPRDRSEAVGRMLKFEREFAEEHQREPLDHEVQDHLGINTDRLEKLRRGVFFEFPEGGTENSVEVDPGESRLARWSHLVYHDLPPRDRLIMDYRMGNGGRAQLSPEEIAAKMKLDVSYVRKRAAAISQKILEGVR